MTKETLINYMGVYLYVTYIHEEAGTGDRESPADPEELDVIKIETLNRNEITPLMEEHIEGIERQIHKEITNE